jgi:hypothetical protein
MWKFHKQAQEGREVVGQRQRQCHSISGNTVICCMAGVQQVAAVRWRQPQLIVPADALLVAIVVFICCSCGPVRFISQLCLNGNSLKGYQINGNIFGQLKFMSGLLSKQFSLAVWMQIGMSLIHLFLVCLIAFCLFIVCSFSYILFCLLAFSLCFPFLWR